MQAALAAGELRFGIARWPALWQGSQVRLLLLLLVPIGDVYLLVVAGRHLGLWPILGFVAASAVVGGALARREGSRIAGQIERARAAGHAPAEGMLSAALAAVAGAMLAFPGPVSTAAGLALLLPPVRRAIGRLARRWFEQRLSAMGGFILDPNEAGPAGSPRRDRDDVIDIESSEVEADRGQTREALAGVDERDR